MNLPQDKSATGVIGLGLLVLIIGGLWWVFDRSEAARPPAVANPIPVVVTRVLQQDVPHHTRAVGTVQSLHSVTIRPQVEGVLTEILYEEGQLVKEGDLLARIDDRAISAALAQVRAAKDRNLSQLETARSDLARYQGLVERKVIPQQTVDQQQALVHQLTAAVASDDALIAAAEVRLSFTQIISPVSGRAGMRRVDPGNLVQPGDSEGLVTVTQIDPIAVIFSLPQGLLPQVQSLLKAETPAQVVAYNRDGGSVLATGRLTLIDNQIDSSTGTIRLKAEFPNAEGRLWPGQFVTVQLSTGTSKDATVVSSSAIQRGREFLYVYRVTGGTVEIAPVTLSYEDDKIAMVAKGLAAGDIVVNEGQSRLKPGAAVTVATDATAIDAGAVR